MIVTNDCSMKLNRFGYNSKYKKQQRLFLGNKLAGIYSIEVKTQSSYKQFKQSNN